MPKTNNKSATEKAMDLLLFKARTQYELRAKLKEKEYSDPEIDEAIDYVSSFGYLNDETYAEQYVISNASQKSISAMRRELKKKGIDEDIITDALMEVDEDESGIVYDLILKRAGEPHDLDEKEERRLFGFCARRGFSTSTILRAFKQYRSEAEEY